MPYLPQIVGFIDIMWIKGLKMESTYILLEYYKIHNPEKLSGSGVSSQMIYRCAYVD